MRVMVMVSDTCHNQYLRYKEKVKSKKKYLLLFTFQICRD